MKICDYGCGQEAKVYFKYSKKWCCSNKHPSCPEIKRKNKKSNIGKSRSIETRRKQSKAQMGKQNSRFGIPHSNETKRKQSISNIGMTWEKVHGIEKTRILKDKKRIEMTGKNNPNWNDGSSFEPYCPIFSHSEWRKIIFERDGHICQGCGITRQLSLKIYNENLSIHHIDYNKKNCVPNNCITTCKSCNGKANIKRDLWQIIYLFISITRDFNIPLIRPSNLKDLLI